MLAVGAGGSCLDILTRLSSLSDSPKKTEILSQRAFKPKTTNQSTNRNMVAIVGRKNPR